MDNMQDMPEIVLNLPPQAQQLAQQPTMATVLAIILGTVIAVGIFVLIIIIVKSGKKLDANVQRKDFGLGISISNDPNSNNNNNGNQNNDPNATNRRKGDRFDYYFATSAVNFVKTHYLLTSKFKSIDMGVDNQVGHYVKFLYSTKENVERFDLLCNYLYTFYKMYAKRLEVICQNVVAGFSKDVENKDLKFQNLTESIDGFMSKIDNNKLMEEIRDNVVLNGIVFTKVDGSEYNAVGDGVDVDVFNCYIRNLNGATSSLMRDIAIAKTRVVNVSDNYQSIMSVMMCIFQIFDSIIDYFHELSKMYNDQIRKQLATMIPGGNKA